MTAILYQRFHVVPLHVTATVTHLLNSLIHGDILPQKIFMNIAH
jgi:hypothetical protein